MQGERLVLRSPDDRVGGERWRVLKPSGEVGAHLRLRERCRVCHEQQHLLRVRGRGRVRVRVRDRVRVGVGVGVRVRARVRVRVSAQC